MLYILAFVSYFLHTRSFLFFFNDTATTEIYTLSLHDALPISAVSVHPGAVIGGHRGDLAPHRSEEHTSELQSLTNLVCRLLLEKKKTLLATGMSSWEPIYTS